MLSIALAVGGLDPCGGAGIAADARAIRAAGAWPFVVSAISTVQTPRGLRAARAEDPAWVRAQIDALAADTRITALKTGALGDAAEVVRAAVKEHRIRHVVVDPVARASLSADEAAPLTSDVSALLPVATLVTPNLPEAERMLGARIASVAQARDAAMALVDRGCRAVLLKGGHGKGDRVVDWLAHEDGVARFSRARRRVGAVHGTGCTLASFVAGRLARRGTRAKLSSEELVDVVRWATRALDRWLRRAERIGPGMRLLVG